MGVKRINPILLLVAVVSVFHWVSSKDALLIFQSPAFAKFVYLLERHPHAFSGFCRRIVQ